MILSSESLSTDVTRIGSLIGVGSGMRKEVNTRSCSSGFIVLPFVDEEIVTLCEVSLTIFTDELFLWSGGSAGASEQPWVVRMVERGRTEARGLPQHVSHEQGGAEAG